jgi:rhodanese-related sulfurtransferase
MFNKEKLAGRTSSSGRKLEKQEILALILGFFLILLVAIFTLTRSNQKIASEPQSIIIEPEEKAYAHKTINAKELHKKIIVENDTAGLALLDIRPFEAYAKEHIVGSINIVPEEFPENGKIDAHDHIIVISEKSTDPEVKNMLKKLKKEGFENVSVLAGGMEAWTAMAGITVTYGDPNSFVDQAKVSHVTQEKLNEAVEQKVPMFIIDVRSPEKFSNGHIPGAKNIPFEELEKRRKEITEKKVVVVGNNELEEFQASVQMYDMLLVSPYVLKGGMPKWLENRFPIEK